MGSALLGSLRPAPLDQHGLRFPVLARDTSEYCRNGRSPPALNRMVSLPSECFDSTHTFWWKIYIYRKLLQNSQKTTETHKKHENNENCVRLEISLDASTTVLHLPDTKHWICTANKTQHACRRVYSATVLLKNVYKKFFFPKTSCI